MDRIKVIGINTDVLSDEIATFLTDNFQLRLDKGTLAARNVLLDQQVAELRTTIRSEGAALSDARQGMAMEHRHRLEAEQERDRLRQDLAGEKEARRLQFERANKLELDLEALQKRWGAAERKVVSRDARIRILNSKLSRKHAKRKK